MRAEQSNYGCGIDEDDCLDQDDKRRTLDLAASQVLAAFLTTSEIISTFQQYARNDG